MLPFDRLHLIWLVMAAVDPLPISRHPVFEKGESTPSFGPGSGSGERAINSSLNARFFSIHDPKNGSWNMDVT